MRISGRVAHPPLPTDVGGRVAHTPLKHSSPPSFQQYGFEKIAYLHSVTLMPHEFLNPRREVEMHGSDLPHWQQGEALQFVTFRLKD